MALQIVQPEDKNEWLDLRKRCVTSTDVSVLFGYKPYGKSLFQLWHEKSGNLSGDIIENERVKWGTRLENAIAQGYAEDNGVHVEPYTAFHFDDEYGVGASFDFMADDLVIEVKNVDGLIYRNNWDEEGDEAPPHIELQVQTQMMLAGKQKAVIVALIGGNTIKVFEREYVPEVGDAIKEACKEFWQSIRDGKEPDPEDSTDYGIIQQVYKAEAGSIIENNDRELAEFIAEYNRLGKAIKELNDERDHYKTLIMNEVRDHEKLICGAYTVNTKMTEGAEVSYFRKPFRQFRISQKKGK